MSASIRHPHIKICGLRDEATIAALDGLPVTEIGLVFAPSKRQVTPEQGAKLVAAIKLLGCRDGRAPQAAGVFVNLELSEMNSLLRQVALDIVQLHGQEPPDYYRQLKQNHPLKEIWKVISIKSDQNDLNGLAELDRQQAVGQIIAELQPYMPYVQRVLLDAPGGGTGKPFNWEAISAYKQALEQLGKPLVVAGGLHEGNVGELLAQYSVDGVDVSSGVETEGVKDIEKITQFVRKVIEA